MDTANRLSGGRKDLPLRGEALLRRGDVVLEEGEAIGSLEIAVKMVVNATIAVPAGGISPAAREAFLASMTLLVRYGSQHGQKREPYQNDSFKLVRLANLALLGREVDGYWSGPNGFNKVLQAGDNELAITFPVSLGHVECIEESESYTGMGPSQAKTIEVLIKQLGQPWSGVDGNLTLKSVAVEFGKGDVKRTNRDQWTVVPERRTITAAKVDAIDCLPGIPLRADDLDAPLETTTLGRITATVDDAKLVNDVTPGAVQAEFARARGTDEPEKSIAKHATPVFIAHAKPLARMVTGTLRLKQEEKKKDWNVSFVYLPVYTEAETREYVETVAEQLADGGAVVAVNTALVEGVKLDHNHLFAVGFSCWTNGDRQHALHEGLVCAKGGRARVFVPLHVLSKQAPAWSVAKSTKQEDLADSVLRTTAAKVPGVAPYARGFKGGESQTLRDVGGVFERYLITLREERARRAANASNGNPNASSGSNRKGR